jgi:uncharacterized membrane protein YgaE (UPF0421/DUF939 family)
MKNGRQWANGLRIGMRNLKTGLAVLLCLLFYQFTGREGGLIATVSAIICMQDNVEKSLINGRNRLAGTVIGAAQGMLFLYIGNYFINDYLTIALIACGVMLLILFCNLMNRSDSIVIACMVFLAIMIGGSAKPPFIYSIDRLLDTFIGVVVAILINRFVLNPSGRGSDSGEPDTGGGDEAAPGESAETTAEENGSN